MDTYYLWDPAGTSINIGKQVSGGFESAFLVKVYPGGLAGALAELRALGAKAGKKGHLEVHCHGGPGALHLGWPDAVTTRNVDAFGTALAAVLKPGGLIELLACSVASQDGRPSASAVLTAPPARIAGYREEYHGVIRRLRKTRDVDDGARRVGLEPVWRPKAAYADNPGSYFTPNPRRDGLAFCLTLARLTQCRVRAAVTVQEEENNDGPLDSPIGDWENDVFDFLPSGKVQYVGFNVSRGPVMRSYELGVTRPA